MTKNQDFNVQYKLLSTDVPPTPIGETLLLDIEVTNTGTAPLTTTLPNPVRLGYHLYDHDGRLIVLDGRRTELPGTLARGQRVRLELQVDSPAQPGEYMLHIELVKEGVFWFAERNIPALRQPIRYTLPQGPRACIVNGNVMVNDAVGNHVVSQLRALRAAGYHTLILTEFVDSRLPADVRRGAVSLRLEDLQRPDTRTAPAVDHFQSADVVIVHHSTGYELAEAIRLVRHGTVILNYHGITPSELWTGDAQGARDLQLGREQLCLLQHVDYAIAHSSFTRTELIETGLIAPDRVRVIPLGVVDQPAYFPDRDAALVERYQLHGRRVLLYVGRMARNKRLADLVEALAVVRRQHPDTVLILVGDNRWGPYQEYATEVQHLADGLGCGQHLIWTGQVPDLEPYFRSCDLFVTASIHEGFCAPAVEAMARGKPVVAAAAAALPETVGNAGLLFEPRNPADLAAKVVRLLDDLPPLAGLPPLPPAEPAEPPAPDAPTPRFGGRTIALVPPRYGLEILGGAERMIRGWAEELARRGYRTEVLTTCTASMSDWSNYYQPGVEEINGITVRRFRTDRVDPGAFHHVLARANRGEQITYGDEQEFARNDLQSSSLNQYLRDHADEYVCAVFAPYLFGTTYWGMRALPDKAILLPCLHDEPSAKLTIFREMLESAAGIFFNAAPECELATKTLGVVNPHWSVVGYGFETDEHTGDAAGFRARHHLPEQILLYSGRLETTKNVHLLLDYFVRYKADHPGPLTLVLAGAGDVPIPERPDIVHLGFLSDELHDAYAAATVLCQPSINESFSIVIMESWLHRRPILVHTDCAVTSDHARKSGGGYTFGDYATFRTVLHRVVSNRAHAVELGQRGRAYVERNYTWDIVTERFVEGITAFVEQRGEYSRLSQHGIRRALEFTRARVDAALLELLAEARKELGVGLSPYVQQQLRRMAQVGMPGYTVQSRLPLIGRLIAWVRRQLTSHLREPYLDPMINRQETFNAELLGAVLPMLEQSLHEQRRLRREIEVLRGRPTQQDSPNGREPHLTAPTTAVSDDTRLG